MRLVRCTALITSHEVRARAVGPPARLALHSFSAPAVRPAAA